ncbi:phage tail tape measure protein [Methylosinus sporium]|uniref:Phage tail tape measure protein n=1 Tax=Methylosinus sporium TaxID=428 RepID=A0A549SLR7_METSR|nr:phage tail tape measure protein [Methylosinus sporium]MBU3887445.1 phage tail tape measure protein [Methylosinus sp. KRF6]TRL30580.1 phage tail tape measure protein [Methylosinus sporium]
MTDSTSSENGAQLSFDPSFHALDLKTTKALLQDINVAAASATKTLSSGLAGAAANGKSFDATLASIARSLAELGVGAGTQALTRGLTSGLSGLLSGAFGTGGGASVAPFAEGGVVASPTFFGANGAVGLMGERGAEAIMPLARGPDGRLGVSMQGAQQSVAVTVNIAAQDVDSFRRSEGQITAALARAVARGRRNI